MKTIKVCGIAWALCLLVGQAADTISWLTSVSEGYFSDAANWTGSVIPTNNTIGIFSGNQTYTVHFPAGGYAENSATKVYLSSGRSLTFDTRGTWWLKDAPTITNGWSNSYTGFQIANSSGSHVFNIEGLSSTYTATNYPIMCLSNAVYHYYSSTTVTNVLEEGLLNLYDPKGITYSSLSLITGSAGTRHVAIFKTNSTLRATQIRMRGNAYGNFMIFEGGDHAIYNGLCLGEGATNAGYTNTVQVAGGTLSLPASYLYIGWGKTGSCGNFSVSGDGAVTVGNQIAMANYQAQSSASLRLSDRAVLRVGSYLDAAYNTSSTATISLANSALLSVGSNLAIARGTGSFTTLNMGDQSACTVGGYLLIGGYSASDGTVTVRDGAVLSVAGYVEAGTSGGTGRLDLAGGRLVAKNVRGGTGGWSELYADGGTLCASNISASVNLLANFDVAELGASGLTLDSAGYDVTVSQAFADASGADGLFLKTGAGTLSASNSSHAVTVIAQGGLRLLDAAASFGRSFVVTNGAFLSLEGTAATLTAGDLTLGTADKMTLLYLDAADCLTVTNSAALTVNSCGLYFGGAAVNGTYTLFRSTAATIEASVLDNLLLLNPVSGKNYAFAIVPDNTDSTLQLTVSDLTVSDALWNGSQGADWDTADNWTPSGVPAMGTRVFFTDTGVQKTVGLSSPATCSHLIFDASDPYVIQGETLSVAAGSVSNALGSHTLSMPLTITGDFACQTASASTTTVSGALSAPAVTTVSKSGSGTLAVSGDNADFGGKWTTSGGRLLFGAPEAFGQSSATNAVTVGAGTLAYAGSSAEVTTSFVLDPGGISNAAIIDAQSDLSVSGTVSSQSGVFVKRGTGALTFAVGSATLTLSAAGGSGGVNITPSGTITLPANGDSPSTATGLGGFTVLEGTVSLKGNGTGVSIINQKHFGIVGGKVTSCQADPVLELDNIRMNQGGAGLHFIVGNQIDANSAAKTPTLRLVNGAAFYPNMIRLGYGVSTACTPTLVMSNSTVSLDWQLNIGDNSQTYPVVRLMQGSSFNSTSGNEWGGGIYAYRNVDVLVSDGSVLGQTYSSGSFRFADSASSGTMRFENGGTMRFARFLGLNYATTAGLNVYFNGGVMELAASGDSLSTAPTKQSFIIEDGGITLRVGSGIRHVLHFPLTGTGALTKTGAGEAVFGEGWAYAYQATNLTGLATGDYTGGTTVQEGTLSVSNDTIRTDATVAIAAGASLNLSGGAVTLDEVSGSGAISNGVLYAGYRCHVSSTNNDCLALADLTIPSSGLTVTFDAAEDAALTNRQVLAVATRSGSTDLNLSAWKASHVGEKMTAVFTLANDTVYATVRYTSGTLISIK